MSDQECPCPTSPFAECSFGLDNVREGILFQVFTQQGIPVTHIIGETPDCGVQHIVVVDLGDGASKYKYTRDYYPWDGREGDYKVEAQWYGLPEGLYDPCAVFGQMIEAVAAEGHFEPIPALDNISLSLTAMNQVF